MQQILDEYFGGSKINKDINPDEAVAYGAAVYAGVLSGVEAALPLMLLDVCPFTLGIETTGGVMTKLIGRGSIIPARESKIFSTTVDNQPVVLIKVYEGERAMTKDNHLLGSFELTGIPPAPRGVPQIEVTFEVDADSILKVSAQDKVAGRSENITITKKSRLSQAEGERMVEESQRYIKEDNDSRERVEAKNST